MLKAILGKLSLITVAASFVLSFSGTETMAAKCRTQCASITDKAAHKDCMKKCRGGKPKKHKKHKAEHATTPTA